MHFTISLNKHDTLRLIGIPDSLVPVIHDTIQTCWLRGIQEESRYFDSWQFKLRGNPWWASGQEAVDSRYLILKLIECLQAYGWLSLLVLTAQGNCQIKCFSSNLNQDSHRFSV